MRGAHVDSSTDTVLGHSSGTAWKGFFPQTVSWQDAQGDPGWGIFSDACNETSFLEDMESNVEGLPPPYHEIAPLPLEMGKTLPTPHPWYNHPLSHAISDSGTQSGATCGLHAVSHFLFSVAALRRVPHTILAREAFEACGLQPSSGESRRNLTDPRGSDYDIAVLHANLSAHGACCFPMTAVDLEGSDGSVAVVAGGRLDDPFKDYVSREGEFRCVGYLLRTPASGGHWAAMLPALADGTSWLCDSLFPHVFRVVRGGLVVLAASMCFGHVRGGR